MSSVSLRTRSTTELLDGAFRIFREHAGAMLGIALAWALPVIAIVVAALFAEPLGQGVFALVMLVLVPVAVLIFMAGDGALHLYASTVYLGQPVDAGAAFRAGWERKWRLLGANIIRFVWALGPMIGAVVLMPAMAAAGSGVGMGLAGLAGIAAVVWMVHWFIRLALVPAVVMLEDRGASESVSRSRELTAGHWGRAFKPLALGYLILYVIQIAAMLVLAAAVAVAAVNPVVTQVLANLISLVAYPVITAVVVLLYYDLRIRKEGFDLEHMARTIGGAEAVLPPSPARNPAPLG